MIVRYDDAVDALYRELRVETPHGVVELTDGINVDTTSDGHIAGIEILGKSIRESVPCIHDVSSMQEDVSLKERNRDRRSLDRHVPQKRGTCR